MSALTDILDEKGSDVECVGPSATVYQAVERMFRARVGALVVIDAGVVAGIFSERDLLSRVTLQLRDPLTCQVADVMTTEIATITPETTPEEAMGIMTARRFRHLPVIEKGQLVGMISIGDLLRWSLRNQEFEIRELTGYVYGVHMT